MVNLDGMLQAIAREQTLVERAQEQLEKLVLEGSYRTGNRLPSEYEMGRMLGVSRTVVREAVRLLVAKGLVEPKTGSGIYVKQLGSSTLQGPMSLLMRSNALSVKQILEVRLVVEVEIAGLAAQRVLPDDIKAMEKTVRQLSRPRTAQRLTPADFAKLDMQFHEHLAEASRNPLFVALAGAIRDVMLEPLIQTARRIGAAAIKHAVIDHTRVLERVKARDTEGARAAMRQELSEAAEVLVDSPSAAAARSPEG